MKIHSIISIIQLKLTISNENFYDKTTNKELFSIEKKHRTKLAKKVSLYEIERLLNKRFTRDYSHYLVK